MVLSEEWKVVGAKRHFGRVFGQARPPMARSLVIGADPIRAWIFSLQNGLSILMVG